MIDSDFKITSFNSTVYSNCVCLCVFFHFTLLTASENVNLLKLSLEMHAYRLIVFFSSNSFALLWSTILFFLLLQMLLKANEREKKRWEFDWISMQDECRKKVARYWNPIEIVCVRERSVWNVRGFHRTQKNVTKTNNQFMICGKVSNGNDYVLHYTLKVFTTAEWILYQCFVFFFHYLLIVFAFVCLFVRVFASHPIMYAPNGMKY